MGGCGCDSKLFSIVLRFLAGWLGEDSIGFYFKARFAQYVNCCFFFMRAGGGVGGEFWFWW